VRKAIGCLKQWNVLTLYEGFLVLLFHFLRELITVPLLVFGFLKQLLVELGEARIHLTYNVFYPAYAVTKTLDNLLVMIEFGLQSLYLLFQLDIFLFKALIALMNRYRGDIFRQDRGTGLL
jgi:hypothetical protein